MKTEEFKDWLALRYEDSKVISSRVSNCSKIEEYYGDLDELFVKDGLKQVVNELTYTKDDKNENRETRHPIPIDGNKYTGTATYKQAANLYIQFREFLAENSVNPDLESNNELENIKNVIEKFIYDKSKFIAKHKKQHKVDALVLQSAIKEFLDDNLDMYKWTTEYKPKEWSNGERVDIYGESSTKDYDVVIELDAHRADQVAKKFVSRMAMFIDRKVIYISICYTGTNKMNVKETEKYFGYCGIVASKLPDVLFHGKILV